MLPLLVAFALVGCGSGAPVQEKMSFPEKEIIMVSTDGSAYAFLVEIANEPQAHARGLMFRESLPAGRGMLFVFPGEAPRAFWMKNTVIPLDIVFWDAAGAFVSAASMTPCPGDPCPLYPSGGPAMFALELPAGTVAEFGIGPGWRMVQDGMEDSVSVVQPDH